jgi:hypothetical protein
LNTRLIQLARVHRFGCRLDCFPSFLNDYFFRLPRLFLKCTLIHSLTYLATPSFFKACWH